MIVFSRTAQKKPWEKVEFDKIIFGLFAFLWLHLMSIAKFAIIILLLCIPFGLHAQTASLQLPFSYVPSGQDRVRSSDGVECQSHVGPRHKWLDVGVYTIQQPATTGVLPQSNPVYGLYARMTISLDSINQGIDCNKLYELEIARLRSEIEELQTNTKINVKTR